MDAPSFFLWLLARLVIGATLFSVIVPFGLWLGRIVIVGNKKDVTD